MVSAGVKVVVPVKPLSMAKTRLAEYLEPESRAELSIAMLSWVLKILAESGAAETLVVGGDDRVRSIAADHGASWIDDRFLELNPALEDAFENVWRSGYAAAYIPSDLPLLSSADVDAALDLSSNGRELAMCPAHDGGTNCLIVPGEVRMVPSLGEGSFERHRVRARRLGHSAREMRLTGFERDVDTIADLRWCIDRGAHCLDQFASLVRELAG